ncbi:Calvin cycle protein [Parasponia andersonii]|uniref:Calvin cycle protein n=1 Tax=Parasponia andersonii TaxID=3476 RepID=A0A2P5CL04_PARAD|nr:Calvin cycle protein [Parasponia andersonii]
MAGMSLSAPRVVAARGAESVKAQPMRPTWLNQPWKRSASIRRMVVRPVYAAPDKISEKVAESIKSAEDACSENPASGECVAAWDEVEELSAAASHARDKKKSSDPLEEYCKDNPETDECRTYED